MPEVRTPEVHPTPKVHIHAYAGGISLLVLEVIFIRQTHSGRALPF
jgi:hypothetical protein